MNSLDALASKVKNRLEQEEKDPFTVAIMGQTGVGKSSLLNALFNVKLRTSEVGPTTTPREAVRIEGLAGHTLLFHDLPGIGISEQTDKKYLEEYKQKLQESHLIIWAIHCDSRSFFYDINALKILFSSINIDPSELMRKMVFVLMKVDLIAPPPWILVRTDENGIFIPQKETEDLLRRKEEYAQENFILQYRDSLTSNTYYDGDFAVNDSRFRYENNIVSCKGFLSRKDVEELNKSFPAYKGVFERLYDNYRVISVSSRFHFNLDILIRIIINKLGPKAITRFSNFYTEQSLSTIPLATAKQFSNIVVVDRDQKKVIFDLANDKFWQLPRSFRILSWSIAIKKGDF